MEAIIAFALNVGPIDQTRINAALGSPLATINAISDEAKVPIAIPASKRTAGA
ncbi:hypothetical protein Brsp01_28030 [Brucella sp. NBRC 12950]|nr:hypothetical protein Brsp01_28030 [Brucella sp. NBRC 12950]